MEASNFSEQSTGMETSPEKKKVKTEPRAETSSSALSGAEEEDIRESLMPDMEEIKEFSEDLEQILPTDSEFGKNFLLKTSAYIFDCFYNERDEVIC